MRDRLPGRQRRMLRQRRSTAARCWVLYASAGAGAGSGGCRSRGCLAL